MSLAVTQNRWGVVPLSLSAQADDDHLPDSPKTDRIPLFSWNDVQSIVSTASLHRFSRHPLDLMAYHAWLNNIKSTHGSVQNYLLEQKFTTPSLLLGSERKAELAKLHGKVFFESDFVIGRDVQVAENDWPYSVPSDVSHQVVWSYLPILHPGLISSALPERVRQTAWFIISRKGLSGSVMTKRGKVHLPNLADLIEGLGEEFRYQEVTIDEAKAIQDAVHRASHHIRNFLMQHLDIFGEEMCFFANPVMLQSIPSLPHFHVLVRRKS